MNLIFLVILQANSSLITFRCDLSSPYEVLDNILLNNILIVNSIDLLHKEFETIYCTLKLVKVGILGNVLFIRYFYLRM